MLPFGLFVLVAFIAVVAVVYVYKIQPKPELDQQDPSRVLPPTRRAALSDHNVAYVREGKGPTLLFLHGIGASKYSWRFMLKDLSQDFDCIALDLPGFGASDKFPKQSYGLEAQADRVIEFCDQLGLTDVGLVGSSMGGALSLYLTTLQPERFYKVLTLAPATSKSLVTIDPAFLMSAAGPLSGLIHERIQRSILKLVFYRTELIHDESLKTYFKPYINNPKAVQTLVRAVKLITKPKWRRLLPEVKVPHTLIYGEHDRLVPRKVVNETVRLIPQTKLITSDRSGHPPMEEEPEWTAGLIREFYQDARPSKSH